MTTKRAFAISRLDAPEVCINLSPQGGRGECRVPAAPAVSCALCIGRTHTSNNEYTGIARHSRTQWFYDLLRALPGDRACLTPSSADMFCLSPVGPTQLRELDANQLRRQDHTTSPYAATSLVRTLLIAHRPKPALQPRRAQNAAASTAPHPAFVTIAIRPSQWDGMARICRDDLPDG